MPDHSTKIKSTSSPFQATLYLSNLPPTIQVGHFEYILSHPPPLSRTSAKRRKREENGITMVQIYTVPRNGKSHKDSLISPRSLATFVRRILCISSSDLDLTSSDRIRRSFDKSPETIEESQIAQTSRRLGSNFYDGSVTSDEMEEADSQQGTDGAIRAVEVDTSRHSEDGSTLESVDERGDRVKDMGVEKGGSEKTVAYIHFRSEYHLSRAKDIFSSITIDSRRIKTRTKRFNPGLLTRWFSSAKKL
ncbi:hypothetical protein CI109_103964 [Kwoniella shandongensis]|uniref:Uncharacterized protein n=1 Tax=Kwoniella shandongensis TaxID=1734106 RepID=A0AAJ8LIZ4_9TREE